jgi:hypothetical protein
MTTEQDHSEGWQIACDRIARMRNLSTQKVKPRKDHPKMSIKLRAGAENSINEPLNPVSGVSGE